MKSRVVPNDVIIPEISRLVSEGMTVTFMTKGLSMLPFITGGRDSVILGRPEDLQVGDIVLARLNGNRFVLHRIELIDGDRFTLMGDGNLSGREYCSREDVLAVALKIIRNGKEKDCRSASHRSRAWIWRRLLPFRRYLLAIYKRICL